MLQIVVVLFYYKLGQMLLQIGASFITKLGQLLQIIATVIAKWESYYKLGQNLLQFASYFKLGHNKRVYHDLMIFHKQMLNIIAFLHNVKSHMGIRF